MMRKSLGSPDDLQRLPSLLGRIFRIALFGRDLFDYEALVAAPAESKLQAWKTCRENMGMYSVPERDSSELDSASTRQQYVQKWTY
jgi:hypothetical protein